MIQEYLKDLSSLAALAPHLALCRQFGLEVLQVQMVLEFLFGLLTFLHPFLCLLPSRAFHFHLFNYVIILNHKFSFKPDKPASPTSPVNPGTPSRPKIPKFNSQCLKDIYFNQIYKIYTKVVFFVVYVLKAKKVKKIS